MAARKYISRVSMNEYSASVEVAICDPKRWPDNRPTYGAKFGFEASVHASTRQDDNFLTAGVAVGGIGSHSPEDAAERIDVYSQGADVARFITDMAHLGFAPEIIGEYLTEKLGGGKPTTARFVYAAGDRDLRASELQQYAKTIYPKRVA